MVGDGTIKNGHLIYGNIWNMMIKHDKAMDFGI
jgi:hypothetical protein